MQPARLGQRPTLVNTQGAIKLRRACYVTVAGQRAAAASQLAVIGLLPAVAPTDSLPKVTHRSKSLGLFARTFGKMPLFS